MILYDHGHLTPKHHLTRGYESFFKEMKGGGDEESNDVGNGFGDHACIYRRMLAMVV
jgi:hypothetical protein